MIVITAPIRVFIYFFIENRIINFSFHGFRLKANFSNFQNLTLVNESQNAEKLFSMQCLYYFCNPLWQIVVSFSTCTLEFREPKSQFARHVCNSSLNVLQTHAFPVERRGFRRSATLFFRHVFAGLITKRFPMWRSDV